MTNKPLAPIQPRRVVITGLSAVTAFGSTLEEFWTSLITGRCGISRLPQIPDDSPIPVKIAGHIPNEVIAAGLARLNVDDPDRANQLALLGVGLALENAGLPTDGKTEIAADCVFGTGHGNVAFNNETAFAYKDGGYKKLRPTAVIRIMANRPANISSIRYKLMGSNFVVSAACATGAIAFGEAFYKVRFGLSERVVSACADTGLDVPSFSAWNRLGVLSKIADPARASRPFDKDRDGIVMGEGAAGFILESLEAAQARGARIYAEVLGFGGSSDATHIVQPQKAGQVRALRQALACAGVAPEEVDYLNAHGTATDIGDVVEASTIREVFGAYADQLPVSSIKAQLGHLMGATSGVELAATVLAMQHGLAPASLNVDEPDPRCPLNLIRGEPLKKPINIAVKNAFAFGGTNTSVVLGRWA